jgi:hypothetical protein
MLKWSDFWHFQLEKIQISIHGSSK